MRLNFYIFEKDYKDTFIKEKDNFNRISEATSVARYKKWFFSAVRKFGRIIPVSEDLKDNEIKNFIAERNVVFLSVHGYNNISHLKIPSCILQLSLGSLLIPQGLFSSDYSPSKVIHLVSTSFQVNRLKSYLGDSAPIMEIFPPKIDTDFYVPATHKERMISRRKEGIKSGQVHIVYAGRWVVTKGLCQLIRILDMYPMDDIVLTLAGNIDEQHRPFPSLTRHFTFQHYLNQEILRKKRPWLRLQSPRDKNGLRQLFWSADLFVYPSIQPDENFGITAREALSCGVAIVSTNFCGLRPLTDNMPWQGIDSYPTINGLRFNLRAFRDTLQRAIHERSTGSSEYYRSIVTKECNEENAANNLRESIEYLIKKPIKSPVKRTEPKIRNKLFNTISDRAFKIYIKQRRGQPGNGLSYGTSAYDYTYPLVQGIYAAKSEPPIVEIGSLWNGFFRLRVWEREKAIVEFGFPGPRIQRYPEKLWNTLIKCSQYIKPDEYIVIPKDKLQVLLVQELVDMGYLVPADSHP